MAGRAKIRAGPSFIDTEVKSNLNLLLVPASFIRAELCVHLSNIHGIHNVTS